MRWLILLGVLGCERSADTEEPVRPRVLVIGIDGADWDILDPLVAEGKMPTLARLMARGSYGTLETIEPILSPIIWTTIATGRRPTDHGITWFMERGADGNMKPISSRLRRVPALWNIASDAGLRVGVYGWWATWPAETVNGYIVSDHMAAHGFGVTGQNVDTTLGKTHPDSLLGELASLRVEPKQISDAEVLEYMNISQAELATRSGNSMDFRNPLHHFLFALAGHKTYENIGREMLSKGDTALSMHYFEATDSLSHLFMKYVDPPLVGIPEEQRERFKSIVPAIYERQDRVLASLLHAAGKDVNVVIVSDHGFKTGTARLAESLNTSVKRAHEWHEKQGVILLSGPSFRQGVRLAASIYDVTPTVLYLLGLPVGTTMPGRVLTEAINAENLEASPPREVVTYASPTTSLDEPETAAEIDPDMLARLSALGYVDTESTPEVLLNRARTAANEGNLTEAIATLEELLAAHPSFVDGEIFLAELTEETGERVKALERWKAMAQRPELKGDGRIQRGYVRAQFRMGDRQQAMATALFRLDGPTEPSDFLLVASLTEQLGRVPSEVLARGAEQHPGDLNLRVSLVRSRLRKNEIDQAKRDLAAVAPADAGSAEVLLLRGDIAIRQGDSAAATEAWALAAETDRAAVEPRTRLAHVAMSGGDYQRADRWLAEALTLGGGAEVWFLRAKNAEASGNLALARRFAAKGQEAKRQ